ncbi:hypothetical protein VaNZ11_007844, partial [Volvox africanus]
RGPILLLVDGSATAASPAVAALAAAPNATALADAAAAVVQGNGSAAGPFYDQIQEIALPYGKPAPYSFLPCDSFKNVKACGAVAADATDGDLSAAIQVAPVCGALVAPPAPPPLDDTSTSNTSDTSDTSDNVQCVFCTAESLTMGVCRPGLYGLRYTVTDSSSHSASLLRLITVEERAALSLSFNFSIALPALMLPPPSEPPALPSPPSPAVTSPGPLAAAVAAPAGSDAAADSNVTAAAYTAAATYLQSLKNDTQLQELMAREYLPAFGVDPDAVRLLNLTAAGVLSAEAISGDPGDGVLAYLSCTLTASLTVELALPPPSSSSSTSSASTTTTAASLSIPAFVLPSPPSSTAKAAAARTRFSIGNSVASETSVGSEQMDDEEAAAGVADSSGGVLESVAALSPDSSGGDSEEVQVLLPEELQQLSLFMPTEEAGVLQPAAPSAVTMAPSVDGGGVGSGVRGLAGYGARRFLPETLPYMMPARDGHDSGPRGVGSATDLVGSELPLKTSRLASIHRATAAAHALVVAAAEARLRMANVVRQLSMLHNDGYGNDENY